MPGRRRQLRPWRDHHRVWPSTDNLSRPICPLLVTVETTSHLVCRSNMMRNLQLLMMAGALYAYTAQSLPAQPISLAGQWQFALDRNDSGVSEGWFGRQ